MVHYCFHGCRDDGRDCYSMDCELQEYSTCHLCSYDVKPALFSGVELCYPDVAIERTSVFEPPCILPNGRFGFVSLISDVFVLLE